MWHAEEALRGRGAVGAFGEEVVQHGVGLEAFGRERMQVVITQGQLAVSAFDAGGGALEDIGALDSNAGDGLALVIGER